MKLFISWSGPLSHKVAIALKEWLPSVIQSVKPYVSSEDIDKGARWSTDIAKELEASTYGIICVTKDNLTAPWINFEAGALAKAIEKSYVAPFLFNLKPSDVEGPLVQFQSVVNDKDDVFKMIISINSKVDSEHKLEATALRKSFDVWWPRFAEDLQKIQEEDLSKVPGAEKTGRDPNEILEELLELARSQQRLITSDVYQSMQESFTRVLQELSMLRIQESFRVQPYGSISGKLAEAWPGSVTGLAGVEAPKVTVLGDLMRGTIKAPVEPPERRQRKGGTSAPSVNETQKADQTIEEK